MDTAKVEWFNDKKGFGLAKTEEGKCIYLHYSQIKSKKGQWRTLEKGQKIKFQLEDKDWTATEIRIVK